jgi:hypothetical protein
VDVRLDVLGGVQVDHSLDGLDVQASSSHIRGDQHMVLARLEVVQHLHARVLVHVPMDARGPAACTMSVSCICSSLFHHWNLMQNWKMRPTIMMRHHAQGPSTPETVAYAKHCPAGKLMSRPDACGLELLRQLVHTSLSGDKDQHITIIDEALQTGL